MDSTTTNSNALARPKKKVKLCIEVYEKQSDHPLFKLPNELYMQIFSYLVGDPMRKVDISSIEVNQVCRPDNYPLHQQVLALIPPFENLKTITRLNLVCKDFNMMIRGGIPPDDRLLDSSENENETNEEETNEPEEPNEFIMKDFERFWLRGFNYYFKLLYWIRTRKLESITMAYGDMTQKDYIENAKAQNVILHYERGKCATSFEDAFDYDQFTGDIDMDASDEEEVRENESSSEVHSNSTENKEEENKEAAELYNKIFKSRKPKYNDPQQSKEQILKRLKQLEIDWQSYVKYFRQDDTSFELCLDVMLMISLHMFDTFDSDNTDMYDAGSGVPIQRKYLNSWVSGSARKCHESFAQGNIFKLGKCATIQTIGKL
ncbi:predicted protein [Naegleria gruberi]|uniref:Predicted protein n=1 Tax=Naegleria gruberi TaxID=5762 RepID=D2VKN8_NAEGR|nr:uncharacterized protein NAEGRDRAFT_69459 [Naegleria gruberi]EFC42628.1 predicted protein [Naegleria gruberi]|eukprot:XP_002675372.1 predicted protein [Naegleria gruberi strain NEG-M]